MTTLLLHSLAAEGKLNWDAPVRDQLPGFKLADPVASERATPRDLVSHRTGMPRHNALWAVPRPPARAEMLARLRHLPPSAGFRTTYQYNKLMFMTAGILAAHASSPTPGTGLCVPTHKDNAFQELPVTADRDVIASAGTIENLTNHLQAHMNQGQVNGRQALPQAFFQAMQTPHTTMPATSDYSPFHA